jgi:hypothetical protein
MHHGDAVVATMADLFDPEPRPWGFRGPYLWQALRERLYGTSTPASADDVLRVLHAAFRELAGVDLASDVAPSLYLPQYAHGGMSSGMICLPVVSSSSNSDGQPGAARSSIRYEPTAPLAMSGWPLVMRTDTHRMSPPGLAMTCRFIPCFLCLPE